MKDKEIDFISTQTEPRTETSNERLAEICVHRSPVKDDAPNFIPEANPGPYRRTDYDVRVRRRALPLSYHILICFEHGISRPISRDRIGADLEYASQSCVPTRRRPRTARKAGGPSRPAGLKWAVIRNYFLHRFRRYAASATDI
ncbi:hypothetical protein EVAR_30573_1 [Eumeta japonica]|uniref:Uncharacterized protein n=1 Tax=Eumeta variegata TaxID=151549 RepID=A0A4C1VRS2_EUMVA|nr:hypothetical protein EVAR_30573_1 [Eumeta japonica]